MNTWREKESVFLWKDWWVGSAESTGKGQVQEICLGVVYFCFNKMLTRVKPSVAKAQTWELATRLGFHQHLPSDTRVLVTLSPIQGCRSWMCSSGSLYQVFLWLRTLVTHMTPKKNPSVSALEVEIWGYIIWKSRFPTLSGVMFALVEYIRAQYCIFRNKSLQKGRRKEVCGSHTSATETPLGPHCGEPTGI